MAVMLVEETRAACPNSSKVPQPEQVGDISSYNPRIRLSSLARKQNIRKVAHTYSRMKGVKRI